MDCTIAEFFNQQYGVPFDRIGIVSGPTHAEEVALEIAFIPHNFLARTSFRLSMLRPTLKHTTSKLILERIFMAQSIALS
jgi:hypothetical protein